MSENEIQIPERFYFHGEEINQFIHVQVPVALIKEKVFRGISDSAKLLYGLLLNRTGLSIRNGWLDENNRTYIIYTIESIMEDLGVKSTKAKTMFAELSNINGTGIGLIKKERVLNKPSRIYVMNFMEVFNYLQEYESNNDYPETSGHCVQKFDKDTSEMAKTQVGRECVPRSDVNASYGEPQIRPTVGRNNDQWTDANPSVNNKKNNYNNIRDNNHINQSESVHHEETWQDMLKMDVMEEMDTVRDLIKDNVNYEMLSSNPQYWDKGRLDELIEIMVEECVVGGDEIINKHKIPHALIKSKFEKYDTSHMQYVLSSLKDAVVNVKNMRRYLLTALYNAPNTIDNYYEMKVHYDMNQPEWIQKPLDTMSKSSESEDDEE